MSTDRLVAKRLTEFYKDFFKLHPPLDLVKCNKRFVYKNVGNYTSKYRIHLKNFIAKYEHVDDEILQYTTSMWKESLQYEFYLTPVNHKDNPFQNLIDQVNVVKPVNVRKFKCKVNDFIATIPEIESNLKQGIKQSIVENTESIRILIQDLRTIEISNIYADRVSASQKDSYITFMQDIFIPSAHAFAAFLENSYLPHCKTSLGLYGCPPAWYKYCLRNEVNFDVEPERIFDAAMKLVPSLYKQVEKLKASVKHQQRFKSREDMMQRYRKYMQDALKITSAICDIPKDYVLPELREISRVKELYEASAYITLTDVYSKEPQVFSINTHDWKENSTSEIKYLVQHEVMPGHSLQNYIANQQKIHRTYKLFSFNDTVEGWALYCESFFQERNTPGEELERLNALIFRAIRVVVDVGIHYKGWSYDEAFKYMKKYLKNTDDNIKSEIMRYSASPGQACTYFIGMLKILEMRSNHSDVSEKDFNNAFLRLSNFPLFYISKQLDILFSK